MGGFDRPLTHKTCDRKSKPSESSFRSRGSVFISRGRKPREKIRITYSAYPSKCPVQNLRLRLAKVSEPDLHGWEK